MTAKEIKLYRGMELQNDTGALVLEYKKALFDKGHIVLAFVPKNAEYVTWWMNEEGATFHGHYTRVLKDAIDDFEHRT